METKRKLRRGMGIGLFAALLCYFSYHTLSGANGVFTLMQLYQQADNARAKLDKVKMEKMQMQHRVSMLYEDSLDHDLLDEQARLLLGYSKPGEVMYFRPSE